MLYECNEPKAAKGIKHHLTEDELDEMLAEADDDEIVRRLTFLKNVYQGDLIKEAANRVGRSESTGDRWNEAGLEGLAPSFGGGRPPKLDDQEQE